MGDCLRDRQVHREASLLQKTLGRNLTPEKSPEIADIENNIVQYISQVRNFIVIIKVYLIFSCKKIEINLAT